MVELLIEIPGLPAQVGRFRRLGTDDLELAQTLHWDPDKDGRAYTVWVSSTDRRMSWPAPFTAPAWKAGGAVEIKEGNLRIQGWPGLPGLKED